MDNFLNLNIFLLCIINVISFSSSQNHNNIPCLIDPNVEKIRENCMLKSCIWDKGGCYLNSTSYGYLLDEFEDDLEKNEYILNRNDITSNTTYFGGDFPEIKITFSYEDQTRLRIKIQNITQNPEYESLKKIFDEKILAYESPLEPATPTGDEFYKIEITKSPVFSFKVIRKSSNVTIFDTSLGGLTLSQQFLQLSVKLPSTNAYGLGEFELESLKLNFDNENGPVYPMYSLDHTPEDGLNLFGVHPLYTVLEDQIGQRDKTGDCHTVIFLNSNAQEFELLKAPGYVYRSIGGIIDILITLGPTPVDNSRQLSEILGKPEIPPYWALGFHLNQQIYSGGLEELKETVKRTQDAEIPLDAIYADVGTMDKQLSFTINPDYEGFPAYVGELKNQGIRLVIVVNSPYGKEIGNETLDSFWIKGENGQSLVGKDDNENQVHFPDFFNPLTVQWWNQSLHKFAQQILFDGVLITENEPSNMDLNNPMMCSHSMINDPPYIPAIKDREMALHSICPSSVHNTGESELLHYDVHNLYGLMSTDATYQALRLTFPEKRKLLISRSTFLGSGTRGGHWIAENMGQPGDMKASIVGMLHFNLWGIPFTGQDICGYHGDGLESLCSRWTQLGAFYPYSRNNNGQKNRPQDPASSPKVTESAKKALSIRYTLLPYMYSVFFERLPVVRPTWYEFPTDHRTYGQDEQFLFGPGILISPVLTAEAKEVKVYFPQPSRWFDYNNYGQEIQFDDIDQEITLPAPLDSINVHVRGGQIIPTQIPDVNTMKSRQNNFGLIVALNELFEAQGQLFYDDGESFNTETSGKYYFAKYIYESSGVLKSLVEINGISDLMVGKRLTSIRLMGCPHGLDSLKVNGDDHYEFTQYEAYFEVYITELLIDMNSNFTIEFTYDESITYLTTTTTTPEPSTKSTSTGQPEPSSTESISESTSLSTNSPDITTTQTGSSELLKVNSFNLLILLICILFV